MQNRRINQLCALGTQLNVYYEAYDLPGLQAMRRPLSPWLMMLLMEVVKLLPPPQSPELYPAMWQEKTMHQFGP
jgi:hypothetical protein